MNNSKIQQKLDKYKTKYYSNILLRNGLLFLSIILIISLLSFSFVYFTDAGRTTRTLLFYIILSVGLGTFFYWIVRPLMGLLKLGTFRMSDEDAARRIGEDIPTIEDKLLNYLQLSLISDSDQDLLVASIEQKIGQLYKFSFSDAVDYSVNKKYIKYPLMVVLLFVIAGVAAPGIITDSPERIIKHRKEFAKDAPFQFNIQNDDFNVYRGDDYTIELQLTGSFIPSVAYVKLGERTVKMQKIGENTFSYTIGSIQKPTSFLFNAAGYESEKYDLKVVNLPELLDFEVFVDYPRHTGLKDFQVQNVGNFSLPEGTNLRWYIRSQFAEEIFIEIKSKRDSLRIDPSEDGGYKYAFIDDSQYEILLTNRFGKNREDVLYNIDVVKDQRPGIEATLFTDTILYEYAVISGSIRDDYGFKKLKYVLEKSDGSKILDQEIKFNKNINSQSYYAQIDLTSFQALDEIYIYAEVTDNDAVNGYKSARTQKFPVKLLDERATSEMIANKEKSARGQMDKTQEKSEELNKQLEELQNRLRTKNQMEWQEEKLIDDVLKKREDIEQQLEQLREEFKNLKNAENKFNNRSERLQEKANNLEKLLEDAMDEETRRLYEELKKLLEQNEGIDQIQQQLSKITPNEKDLENELERAVELFKRLQMESKLEKASKDLEKMGQKQQELADENLSEETSKKKGAEAEEQEFDEKMEEDREAQSPEDNSENSRKLQEQEKVNQDFKKMQEEIKEIQELNQDLKEPEPLENTNQEQQEIQKELEDILKKLQDQQNKSAGQQQRQAGQKMKELGKKMESMQMGMEMQMMMENIDQLRKILDDLIRLSFNQEEIIEGFREVNQIDPKYIELSQAQLKLKRNAKVIEDSLLALASRVPQISSFVTREVGEMNRNVESAVEELRNRNRSKAMSDQQFAMTSMNNLALLLDDVLQNMQNSMSQSMGNPKNSKKGNKELPNLKELQKQLSDDIKQLQKGQKQGRRLSEELARMAAEQQMIREQLKKLSEQLGDNTDGEKGAGGNIDKLMELMEDNETDLVNKKITRQLIERQQDIETRLLEAEDALRQQKTDEEREATSAKQEENKMPPEFEKYLREREIGRASCRERVSFTV